MLSLRPVISPERGPNRELSPGGTAGGLGVFVVGLLLSAGFLEPDVPEFWQNLLGNGVFLVIGWVGLWYPLDLLFFARQPLKREALIVKAISRMPLFVHPADVP